jgi:hypothetical protein
MMTPIRLDPMAPARRRFDKRFDAAAESSSA